MVAASVPALLTPLSAQAIPVDVTPPVISGSPVVGQTLTASTGTWTDSSSPIVSYGYQWMRCVQYVCQFLAGADSSSFGDQAAHVGEQLAVTVYATDAEGASEGAESEETTIVTYEGPRYSLAESVTGSGFIRGFVEGHAEDTVLCPGSCGASSFYWPGEDIELVAEPLYGAGFQEWTGACEGYAPTCSISLEAAASVTAHFSTVRGPAPPNTEAESRGNSPGTPGSAGARTGEPQEPATGAASRGLARLVSVRARHGHVEAVAACERASACHLSLALLSGRRSLARHAFAVPAWSSVGVTLALDSAGARLLARRHRLPLTARLALSAGGRWAAVGNGRVTLTR